MPTVADLLVRIEANTQQLRNELKNCEQHLNGFEGRVTKSTLRAGTAFDRLGSSAKATIAILSGFGVGLGVAEIATGIARVNAQFQDLYTGLKVATGGAREADAAFADLRVFAKVTPFQLSEVTQAFIQLKNLGLDGSIDSLRAYGDIASSFNGKSINDFIEAVSDATMGEFERLKEFGIKASSEGDKVAFTFRKMTTTIGKNATEIERYLQDLARNNFGGAMSEKMQNLSGRFSNLKDQIDDLYVTIGEGGGIDVMAAALDLASQSLEGLTNNLETVGTVIALVGAAAAGKFLGPMIGRMGAATVATRAAIIENIRYQATLASMAGVSRAAAVGLTSVGVAAKAASASLAFLGGPVGAAITVLAGGVYLLSTAQTDAKKAADLHREAMEQLNGFMEKFNDLAKTAAERARDSAKARIEDARAANQQVLAATQAQMAQLKQQRGLLERSSPGSPLIEGVNAELTALSFELVSAKDRVDDLDNALKRLDEPGAVPPAPPESPDDTKEADKIAKVIDGLRFQQDQLTRTSREQAVYNALQSAGVDQNHASAAAIRDAALAYYDANDAVEKLAEDVKAEDEAFAAVKSQIGELRLENQLLQVQGVEREKLRAILEAEAASRKGVVFLGDQERAQIEGLIEANERLRTAEEEAAEAARDARQFARDFGNVISSSFEDAILSGEKLGDVLKSLEQDIARIILRMSITKPLENAIGGAFGSFDFGSMFGSMFGGAVASGPGISLPLRQYSGGGIANSPQLAMFGEGAVPEAYVPVPSGKIPVELNGAGESFTYAPTIIVDAAGSKLSASEIRSIVKTAVDGSVAEVRNLQKRKGNARI